jgi:hypothetical protein
MKTRWTSGLNCFAEPAVRPTRGRWLDRVFELGIAASLIAAVLYLGCVVVPDVRSVMETAKELRDRTDRERSTEAERLRLVNEARKSEVVNIAKILADQERALRQLREVNERLAAMKRDE